MRFPLPSDHSFYIHAYLSQNNLTTTRMPKLETVEGNILSPPIVAFSV